MKIKSPMMVGDRVHVVRNGKNEYDGVILPGFTYSYGRDEFRFRVKTDQEIAEEDIGFPSFDGRPRYTLCTSAKDCTVIKGGEQEIYVPDPLKSDSVLEWEYNGRRILNTARTTTCKVDSNGMYTKNTVLDSGDVISDTEPPEGFPEIKMTGHYVIEAKVEKREDDKTHLSLCKLVDHDDELTQVFTSLIRNASEILNSIGKANLMAYLIPKLPVDLDYDKITFYAPKYNIKLGDSIQLSCNGQNYDTVVSKLEHKIITSSHPAEVTLTLVDKATEKKFNVAKSFYKVIELPSQSGLGSMNLF